MRLNNYMATIINNPGNGDGSGSGFMVGIVVAILVVIAFSVWGLPALRNRGTPGTPGVPGVDIQTSPAK